MATFLQLVRDVARESGTVPAYDAIATTTGLSGREARIVHWVRDAWVTIQQEDPWDFLEADFEGRTIAGQRSYIAQGMGITSRFGEWVPRVNAAPAFTIDDPLRPSRELEMPLLLSDWPRFRSQVLIGQEHPHMRPNEISVAPDDALWLDPIPDRAYIIRGRYRKSPQRLVEPDDVPDMPARFHPAIMWRALMRLAVFDEATEQFPAFSMEYDTLTAKMRATLLPAIEMPRPLA